jgi:hypothetical protein
MAKNAFFEITGMMQIVPGFMTGYYLYGFVRDRQRSRHAASESRLSGAINI